MKMQDAYGFWSTPPRAPVPAGRLARSRQLAVALLALSFLMPSVRVGVHLARAEEPMAVDLFDTGTASPDPLPADALSKREGWTMLPEDETRHEFKGDVVFTNGKLAIVLRRKGRGAEVHAMGPTRRPASGGCPRVPGLALRAELVAVAGAPAAGAPATDVPAAGSPPAGVPAIKVTAVKILENNPGVAAVDATFATAAGESLTIGYELKLGEVFVQTEPRSGAIGLQVVAPCRFAVLPDFFADDIVVDAAEMASSEAELPSENFLLHMLGEGEAVAVAVWHPAKDDVRITLSGQEKKRVIASSEIHYAKGGKACLAVIEGPGTWHARDIAGGDAGKDIRLDWKAPYAAQWRVDWRRDDALTDSWDMLTQKPDGEYVKHGWYGQPESFGNVDWLKPGRERWTTVLGRFLYPCWVDKEGAGHLQPLERGVRFQGPAIVYPINRLEETPLAESTIVDVMRATLGVGPCEYILDIEGQKKTFEGRPTCASRTILDGIYAKGQQKPKRDEVKKTLDEVHAFVRHIRGRIESYVVFGHDVRAYLEEEKKARPELAGILSEMQEVTRRIDGYVERKKGGIKTPEYASSLVEEFRTTLVDHEGGDALAKCKRITAALVDIGGNQDELVGECRMVVKVLRQRAAVAMAADPRLAPVARELRRRTQQMLRSPTSYEAPRH